MNKEFRSAAARMLTRAQALGLTTKSGNDVVVDLMEELLAASQGFRNAHACRAALDKQATAPDTSGSPSELHVTVQPGQDCWIAIGPYKVHPNLTDEGISVDVYADGADHESIASTWALQSDAEEALCEQLDLDIDDVSDWAHQQGCEDFDGCSLAERWSWLQRFIEMNKDHPAPKLSQWRDVLDSLGYEFEQDPERAGNTWRWLAPTDESETWFASEDDAVGHAWRDVCTQVMAARELTPAQWTAMPFEEHARLLRALMD